MVVPVAPLHRFASDNNAAVHPRVMEALAEANHGHAVAYGDDPWTERAAADFDELFDCDTVTLMVWNGTGANVLGLASALSPGGAVVCTDCAHINVDETGAPERILGSKLIDLPASNGKLSPRQLQSLRHQIGVVHHVQPRILSITQSTEWGTLYSVAELEALCHAAHDLGLYVHLDGARIANATAALGGTREALRSFTTDIGVDVISFGGTKNGMMYGEAVVFLDRSLASHAGYVRKQITQLPSKVRYISAQFSALLHDDLWIRNASHANQMATLLHSRLVGRSDLSVSAPEVNSTFPTFSPAIEQHQIEALREWSYFYDWDTAGRQVRWMTAWDTQPDDVERLVAGLDHFLA
ncbi:MAG: threonine aldolase family protein [Ilumatobacteraceae bacterium]